MKVLLVSNYANDRQVSMQRFAKMLEANLARFGCQVKTVCPKAVLTGSRHTGRGLAKWLGYIDKFLLFPPQLRLHAKCADIVHLCDHSNAAYTKFLAGKPHVVTCHDLLAVRSALGEIPQNPTRWSGRFLQRIILNGLNRAMHVACPSRKTRQDLLRITRHTPETCSTVYNGLNYDYHPVPQPDAIKQANESEIHPLLPFVLHVGGGHWYKNREMVIRVFQRLRESGRHNLSLVMVGPPLATEQQQSLRDQGLDSAVHIISECPDETLRALYSLAECLLFPSLDEGFGWPVIEAQACGCRVVTSDRAPLTEIGGNAALHVNPEDPAALTSAVLQMLDESVDQRRNRVERGETNAALFSMERMIEDYVNLYGVLCGETAAGMTSAKATMPPRASVTESP